MRTSLGTSRTQASLLLVALFLLNNNGEAAFVTSRKRPVSRQRLLAGPPEKLPFAERIRPGRRDVYDYDQWVQARNPSRFVGNLLNIAKSNNFRNLLKDLIVLSSLATLVCLYNGLLATGYYDLDNVYHSPIAPGFPILKLPGTFFALLTPSLALLLVFRTKVAYSRWDEARKNWGLVVNHTRSIMRQGAAWIHEATFLRNDQKQRLLERLQDAVWCFARSQTRHFLSSTEDELPYARDVHARLRPDLAVDLMAARHKPTRALYELSCAIQEFPLDERRRLGMEESVSVLCNAMGSSERIFTSPVPRFYTRHTARFTELWLALAPLGLYDVMDGSWNHCAVIPYTFVLGFFILGIEELSLQLEEPLSLLPQHAITANSIGKVATESVEWRRTDYERMLDAYESGRDFQ